MRITLIHLAVLVVDVFWCMFSGGLQIKDGQSGKALLTFFVGILVFGATIFSYSIAGKSPQDSIYQKLVCDLSITEKSSDCKPSSDKKKENEEISARKDWLEKAETDAEARVLVAKMTAGNERCEHNREEKDARHYAKKWGFVSQDSELTSDLTGGYEKKIRRSDYIYREVEKYCKDRKKENEEKRIAVAKEKESLRIIRREKPEERNYSTPGTPVQGLLSMPFPPFNGWHALGSPSPPEVLRSEEDHWNWVTSDVSRGSCEPFRVYLARFGAGPHAEKATAALGSFVGTRHKNKFLIDFTNDRLATLGGIQRTDNSCGDVIALENDENFDFRESMLLVLGAFDFDSYHFVGSRFREVSCHCVNGPENGGKICRLGAYLILTFRVEQSWDVEHCEL